MRNKALIIGLVVLLVVGGSSGWVYNFIQKNNNAKAIELAVLQQTFLQQYGDKAVIKQMVSPEKVYAVAWTDGDGLSHVSWNIGGLWVTVFSGSVPTTTAPAP